MSANNIPYEFSFFDVNNDLIISKPGNLFLLPGQTKYVILPKITSNKSVSRATLTFTQTPNWQKRLQLPKISITTPPPLTYNQFQPPTFIAEGSYTNQSPYRLRSVRLTIILYDSSGAIIGSSQRDDFDLLPFERRAYKILWPNVFATNIGKTEVVAETNILDPMNITLPTENNPASDLTRPSGNSNY